VWGEDVIVVGGGNSADQAAVFWRIRPDESICWFDLMDWLLARNDPFSMVVFAKDVFRPKYFTWSKLLRLG
jgi:hypothetical protein